MELYKPGRALAIAVAASLMLSSCAPETASDEPEAELPTGPTAEVVTGDYDLQVTPIGEFQYDIGEDYYSTGTVLEYTYVKDGIRTTCSVIETSLYRGRGAGNSCRFEPAD